jgi:hypothetical protein
VERCAELSPDLKRSEKNANRRVIKSLEDILTPGTSARTSGEIIAFLTETADQMVRWQLQRNRWFLTSL